MYFFCQIETHAEDEFSYLNSLSLDEMTKTTKKLIGKFPNTYSYTKNLGERLLTGRKGETPFCILRPSIINPSYSEPFPGWIDSLAATVGGALLMGLGGGKYGIID